jgi:hypothetical protein
VNHRKNQPEADPGAGSNVEDDGHRAVVDQLDLHPRSEDPGLDVNAERAERLAEVLD